MAAAAVLLLFIITASFAGVLLAEQLPGKLPSAAGPDVAKDPEATVHTRRDARSPRVAAPARNTPNNWFYTLLSDEVRGRAERVPGALALVVPLTARGKERRPSLVKKSLPPPPPTPRVPLNPRRGPFAHRKINTTSRINSSQLVASFRAYKPSMTHLPPIVPHGRPPPPPPRKHVIVPVPAPAPKSLPVSRGSRRGRQTSSPSTPRFTRSLAWRGRLEFPRPGFSEYYNASWHAPTGSMRVDFFDGATSVFRTVDASKIYRLERRQENYEEARVRCSVMTQDPDTATPADLAPPGLPDLTPFAFIEYVQYDDIPLAERWRHTVEGREGEPAAAPGESLTYRHEALVVRGTDDEITPLQYSVEVDSSVLGPATDGHVHYYEEVRAQEPPPALIRADTRACDVLERTAELERVDPLREFTLLKRDPRHDDILASYKKQFNQQYSDDVEEAVRKTTLKQSSAFIGSANRVGASYLVGATVTSTKLSSELGQDWLKGAHSSDEDQPPPAAFPYSAGDVSSKHAELPERFDWRDEGGVTHVRNQLGCSSCWAFAAVCALEGLRFRRERALEPLSEQAIIDCSGENSGTGQGCDPSPVSSTYGYAIERGVPLLAAYTPYAAEQLECVDYEVAKEKLKFIKQYVEVPKNNTHAIKVAIKRHAPVVVVLGINPENFKNYVAGRYDDMICQPAVTGERHAMAAVGWERVSGRDVLIIKNSYSEQWGEKGYMKIWADVNTCGVLDSATYPD